MLYLYGNLPFEQKAIRRAINASPDIELDDRYIDSRNRRQWPIDLGTDFTGGKYDAFILSDVDASRARTASDMLLAAPSKKAKGLLMLGGNAQLRPRALLRGTPIGRRAADRNRSCGRGRIQRSRPRSVLPPRAADDGADGFAPDHAADWRGR